MKVTANSERTSRHMHCNSSERASGRNMSGIRFCGFADEWCALIQISADWRSRVIVQLLVKRWLLLLRWSTRTRWRLIPLHGVIKRNVEQHLSGTLLSVYCHRSTGRAATAVVNATRETEGERDSSLTCASDYPCGLGTSFALPTSSDVIWAAVWTDDCAWMD